MKFVFACGCCARAEPSFHLPEKPVCGTVCLYCFWTPHTQYTVSDLIHTRLFIARLLSICGKFTALAFIEAQGLQCTSTESCHNHLHLFEALQLPPVGRPAFPSLPHHNILEWKGELYLQLPHCTFRLNFLKFSVKVHLKCVRLIDTNQDCGGCTTVPSKRQRWLQTKQPSLQNSRRLCLWRSLSL